jgi:hypothetical protein
MPPINADDLSWTTTDADDAAWRRKRLGAAAGGADLGRSLYELPPGGDAERSLSGDYMIGGDAG